MRCRFNSRLKSKQEPIEYVVFLVQSYFAPKNPKNEELTIINIFGKYCRYLAIQWLLLHQHAQNFSIFIGSYDGFSSIYQLGDYGLLVSQSCLYCHYTLRKQRQSSTTLRW